MTFPATKTNAVDNSSVIYASHINKLEDKVGIDNSNDANSLDYKLNHLSTIFAGFSEDTSPTSADLVITAGGEKVTIGNLFANAPATSFRDNAKDIMKVYWSGTEQVVLFPAAGIAFDDTDTLGGLKISGGMFDFFGTVAAGGGQGRIGIVADELHMAFIDDGPTHQNQDIALYAWRNVNLSIEQNKVYSGGYAAAGWGSLSMREIWTSPAKDFKPFLVRSGYPNSGFTDWYFMHLTPDFSRLAGTTVDGYTVLRIDPTTTGTTIIRKDLMWLGLGGAKKFEIDAVGDMYLASGFRGGFNVQGLDTPVIPLYGVEPLGTTGATTWGYKVVAVNSEGTSIASAERTITNGNATLGAVNYNRIRFQLVTGATSYKIYRTTAGGTPNTTGLIGTVTEASTQYWNTLNDKALAAGGETPEATNTTGRATIKTVTVNGDILTGVASSNTLTNAVNTTVTNDYVVAGGQAATTHNTGWMKIYIGTDIAWIPYWTNATP